MARIDTDLLLPSERLIRSVTAAITGIRISMSSYSLNIKSVTSFTIWLIFSFPKFINCKFHLTNKTMWVMCYHIYTRVHVPPIQWHRILFVNTKRITIVLPHLIWCIIFRWHKTFRYSLVDIFTIALDTNSIN